MVRVLVDNRSKIIFTAAAAVLVGALVGIGVYWVRGGELQFGQKKFDLPSPAKSTTLGEVLNDINSPQVIAYDETVEIDYSPKYKNFLVTIKKANTIEQYREYKKHAESYLKAMKADVCQLKIAYAPPQNLKGQIGAADVVPYGCP